jgi:hypothetical protein
VLLSLGSDRQCDVNDGLPLRFPRLQAFSHHLSILTLKVSFFFGVDLLLGSRDYDSLVLRAAVLGRGLLLNFLDEPARLAKSSEIHLCRIAEYLDLFLVRIRIIIRLYEA